MSKNNDPTEAIHKSGWTSGQDNLSADELADALDVSVQEVYDMIWDQMRARELLFLKTAGAGAANANEDRAANTSRTIHLPTEFDTPDEFDREPNEKTHDQDATFCRNHDVYRWSYKSPAVWPPGYRDICQFCLANWAKWHGVGFGED